MTTVSPADTTSATNPPLGMPDEASGAAPPESDGALVAVDAEHGANAKEPNVVESSVEGDSAAETGSDGSDTETPNTLRKELGQVRKVIPSELRRPNNAKALFYLGVMVTFVAASFALSWWVWTTAAWYLAPVAWWFSGMAAISSFIIGHDCGHRSFVKSHKLMNMIGHVAMILPAYPFWAWKHSHDAHHQHTNSLQTPEGVYFDNAWIPMTTALYKRAKKSQPRIAFIYRISRIFPPLGSLIHLLLFHFKPSLYTRGDHKAKVRFSIAFLLVCQALLAAGCVYLTGSFLSIIHFLVIPILGCQYWMSTYTLLHHTVPDTKFFSPKDWDGFKGQVENTLNVYHPRWVSFLHFNIDVHVPHHVMQTIASYNLRAANNALKASEYGPFIREEKFSFKLLYQASKCQLWDRKKAEYTSFKEQGV